MCWTAQKEKKRKKKTSSYSNHQRFHIYIYIYFFFPCFLYKALPKRILAFFIQSSPKKNSSLCLFFGCMVTNLFLLWVTQVSRGWISPLTWSHPNSVVHNPLRCCSHVVNEFYSKRGKYRSLAMIDFHL